MPAPLSDVQRVLSGGKLDDQWIFGVFNHSITTSVACQIHFLHYSPAVNDIKVNCTVLLNFAKKEKSLKIVGK